MGYATIMNVPIVFTYEKAKQLHDNNKPIRGRSPEIRPLGNRRDVDSYSVRMNGDDVEFVLYKTPVITYKPNGDVVLFTDGYNSVSTHQFISRILNIDASSSRRISVITLGEGKRYTMDGKDRLTLRKEDGNWSCVAGAQTQFTWNLNRQSAKEVRLRYKEFIDYFKAMVNLRKETIRRRYYSDDDIVVRLSLSEMMEAFGVQEDGIMAMTMSRVLNKSGLGGLNTTPRYVRYMSNEAKEELNNAHERFLTLLGSDQSEENKHMNFYRGALAFMYHNDFLTHENDDVLIRADILAKKLDTFLLRLHAKEVLVRKELPMGAVSSGTYDEWIVED